MTEVFTQLASPPMGGWVTLVTRPRLIEHWDGRSWAIVASPIMTSRTNDLAAVSVLGSKDAWTVGDYLGSVRDLALTEHWDGTSWTAVDAENPSAGINRFACASAVNAANAWAVGFLDGHCKSHASNATMRATTALNLKDVWLAGATSQGHGDDWLIQHWGRTHWSLTTPARGATGIANATVAAGNSAWAMGTYRTNACAPDWALIQRWDGTSWTYAPGPDDGHL